MDSLRVIEYKNLVIKSDSFRFIINYFLPRPNYALLSNSLNLSDCKFHRGILKDLISLEAMRKESDIFKNQVFAKIKRLIRILSSPLTLGIIPRILLLETVEEGKLVDSFLQIFLDQLHKNELEGSRFVCVDAFDPNHSENSINKLAISKMMEVGKMNAKSLFIVYIAKMKDLELKKKQSEFISYIIEEFSKFDNAVIIMPMFTSQAQQKSKKSKSLTYNEKILEISFSIDLKKLQKRIVKENIIEDRSVFQNN